MVIVVKANGDCSFSVKDIFWRSFSISHFINLFFLLQKKNTCSKGTRTQSNPVSKEVTNTQFSSQYLHFDWIMFLETGFVLEVCARNKTVQNIFVLKQNTLDMICRPYTTVSLNTAIHRYFGVQSFDQVRRSENISDCQGSAEWLACFLSENCGWGHSILFKKG